MQPRFQGKCCIQCTFDVFYSDVYIVHLQYYLYLLLFLLNMLKANDYICTSLVNLLSLKIYIFKSLFCDLAIISSLQKLCCEISFGLFHPPLFSKGLYYLRLVIQLKKIDGHLKHYTQTNIMLVVVKKSNVGSSMLKVAWFRLSCMYLDDLHLHTVYTH